MKTMIHALGIKKSTQKINQASSDALYVCHSEAGTVFQQCLLTSRERFHLVRKETMITVK